MAVTDYNTNPNLNVTISGIDIGENCPAGNLNGAIRQAMADIRLFYNGVPASADFIAKTGGVFTGNPTFTGRGGYLHHNDAANTGGRVFIQAAGGSVPAGMAAGDILLEY